MARGDLSLDMCTISRAVEAVGDEWSLTILREMFLRVRRFDALQRNTGASAATLSKRLKRMEASGLIRKEQYSDTPPRHEYRLTAMGRDLWPVIIAMKTFGDKWLSEGPAPITLRHKTCGAIITPVMTCPACGEPMQAHDADPIMSDAFREHRASRRRQ